MWQCNKYKNDHCVGQRISNVVHTLTSYMLLMATFTSPMHDTAQRIVMWQFYKDLYMLYGWFSSFQVSEVSIHTIIALNRTRFLLSSWTWKCCTANLLLLSDNFMSCCTLSVSYGSKSYRCKPGECDPFVSLIFQWMISAVSPWCVMVERIIVLADHWFLHLFLVRFSAFQCFTRLKIRDYNLKRLWTGLIQCMDIMSSFLKLSSHCLMIWYTYDY